MQMNAFFRKLLTFQDARPMIEVIKFERDMGHVMRQVFGRTLIVRNMETGTKLAKSENIDCVTLEGSLCLFRLLCLFLKIISDTANKSAATN
jgi:chromosome segregation ATPase